MLTAQKFWKNRSVLITGHTGFKGGWLSAVLNFLGAELHGFSLHADGDLNFYNTTNLRENFKTEVFDDIRDPKAIHEALCESGAEVVFHLAAQPLVNKSYSDPVETFSTNLMGTVNLLDAVRRCPSIKSVVNITTDKCYENQEWEWPYRETDKLGGDDPYSSSKACAELATKCYRKSFMENSSVFLASARAGNVVGGGDWAVDRIIPDLLRAYDHSDVLSIRSPDAIRPWQHVLEPIYGYILLAENLLNVGNRYARSWNFGPESTGHANVLNVVEYVSGLLRFSNYTVSPRGNETKTLRIDSSLARNHLNWKPKWNLEETLTKVVEWHMEWKSGGDMGQFSLSQIRSYISS